MPKETLSAQINEWHAAREHTKIRDVIMELPDSARTDELSCLLSRALINIDDHQGALDLLESISDSYSDTPLYCFRRGLSLFLLHREHEALPWFRKAHDLGLEVIDEIPGTYYPKSVIKWIDRATVWAPRRIEKNAFETQRRAEREKIPQESDFTSTDIEGLWKDSDYSLTNYVGRTPTEQDFASVEAELGYRLPASYKALMKKHNGGILAKNHFENPLLRDWTVEMFSVDSIYGIDREKCYSLCGERGSKFWIEEWGYPNIGVAICDTISGGHDMIFLDYSDCGAEGEPCVVCINQEDDYEITYLADDFASFVRGLVTYEDEA